MREANESYEASQNESEGVMMKQVGMSHAQMGI
jgi:hypothetical protein